MSAAEAAPSQTSRSVGAADIGPLSQSLGRAFHDDPMMCHLLTDDVARPARLSRLFTTLIKLALPDGTVDMTPGHEAAAIWRPPGKWHVHWWQYITNGPALISVFGGGLPRVLSTMDLVEKLHPKTPHWYLQVLGTDTRAQGKGFGSKVMRPRLAEIDAARIPCYLESSKESNIPIYRTYGFEVTGEIHIPHGPVLYPMWREPRA